MGLREQYGAFNVALQSLYKDEIIRLAKEDKSPDFDDAVFENAANVVYENGGFDLSLIQDPAARAVIAETFRVLDTAIDSGLPHEVPATLRYALENNAFIFSGFKAFHALREVGLSMTTEKGEIKPFNDFLEDVRKINATYNHNYLYAEYNHALGASQMAAKWHEFEQDGDRYNLQYRTAGDDRVREEHALLHGTTLPPSDPFWDSYFPPNGWNCRCTAVQVRKNKYPTSDPDLAMKRGENCTDGAKRAIFRYNPGKTMDLFPPKHPYRKVPKEVKEVVTQMGKVWEQHHKLYEQLSSDPDYKEVVFDKTTGGLRADHIGHNFDKEGGMYERHVQLAGFKEGHAVILENEVGNVYGERYTEGTWDGMEFEVAGRKTGTANNILSGLKHCAHKRKTQIAVIDFPKGNFDRATFEKALRRYKGLEKLNDGQFVRFVKIICVQNSIIVHVAEL